MNRLFIILVFASLSCFGQDEEMFFSQNGENNIISGNGYLYNWYAISDAKFAPSGWHVPSQTEMNALQSELGGSDISGGHLKSTSSYRWNSPNTGADNSSGFTLFASGYRAVSTGYLGYGTYGLIGSITTDLGSSFYGSWCVYNSDDYATNVLSSKKTGESIRLIKDDSTNPGTLTDYDGNIYTTIKIGDQVWIVENWKCTHLNEGTDIPEVTNQSSWDALTTGARCVYNNDESYK